MMMPEDSSRTPYRTAVVALDAGEITQPSELLAQHPSLVGDRCRVGEWYETGYFKGATLLHHVAGNPIRCPLPANILDVARVLLVHGADPNVTTDGGETSISLILTSKQASEAGVALSLIDLLQAAGADEDLSGPDVLTRPILNHAPATAAELVHRGATMDIRHAAGLGRVDAIEALLAAERDPSILEEALAFACVRGQGESVRALLRHGARGDVLVTHGGRSPCTALHEAANRGYLEIVTVLLAHGADATVVEPQWGGTPAGWAERGGHPQIAAFLRQHISSSAP